MSVKQLAALTALALLASTASAHQNGPSRGTHITVAKPASNLGDYTAAYNTIQAAVNAARPGQVIEILDEAEYAEQVTIDGREASQTLGAVGGKNGITIRYIPPAGAAVTARPTVKYQDRTNTSPKTCAETQVSGDNIGQAGNFETNGAVRILRTNGITIEGLIIDGGGASPFGNANVWQVNGCSGNGNCMGEPCPLYHGNAAIAVAVSGNVQIRDCELRNAHFGIAVKDRNLGGVFGNPNPADIDVTVPLSGFGKTGNHLFEYNKIHDNTMGIYFESSWDLGSTVRYNLLYGNYQKAAPAAGMPGTDGDKGIVGAIGFKDNYLSPIAIYNNTFYDNHMNLVGHWQIGYQHLIFNNIFSKPHAYGMPGTVSYMGIDHMFPNRMKHCVFAADSAAPQVLNQNDSLVTMNVQFTKFQLSSNTAGIASGALISGAMGTTTLTFPSDANIRWLETAGSGTGTASLPVLFKSITPASPDFLVPDWEHVQVQNFIKNKGWPAGGIVNEDGTIADLGAIQYNGKRPCDGVSQTSRARVSPYGIVTVSGTTAVVKINISEEIGSLSNLTVKYIRWIAPIPDNTDSFGGNGTVVPAASVKTVTVPAVAALAVGANQVNITVPTGTGTYGFFELVLEGKDGIGRTVTTDVGFLPYRQLDYYLDIKAFKGTAAVTEVEVGEPVTLRVTAMNRATNAQYTTGVATTPFQVEYALVSDPAARMWQEIGPPPANPLVSEPDLRVVGTAAYTKDYTVYFTKSGSEIISAAGIWCNGPCETATQRLPFLGDLSLKVRSGSADRVVFQNPISKKYLPAGVPPPVASGYYAVQVQAQDKLGNPSDVPVPVTLRVLTSGVANVVPAAATTDPVTGIAEFTVHVTNGAAGDIFDLEALMISGDVTRTDTASLMVGRPPAPEGSPKAVDGGYVSVGGVIRSAFVTFDRDASHDWFSSVEFAFGKAKGTLTNMACVVAGPTNMKTVSIDFECAFPGTEIPETMGNNSEITINFSGSYSWAPLTVSIVNGEVSVLAPTRHVPQTPKTEEAAAVPPAIILAGEFAAGPNPVSKQLGNVNFYRIGRQITNCELRIYDATGNFINKIKISDKALNSQAKRQAGSWDLRDKKGRLVSDGTYLVKGTLKTRNGGKEKISLILGVR